MMFGWFRSFKMATSLQISSTIASSTLFFVSPVSAFWVARYSSNFSGVTSKWIKGISFMAYWLSPLCTR